ncbi:XRE family transcriptional regulator [Apilactobacillus micheneri]|uniref:XRE family transcriptional regulator n=1 Tax=Apilactobacillus micheneri TaxID=1899430 RepID=UPI001125EA44|nr:helix-turn-helix transcriptional regulator [Apilactobacillus micheneri]TPR43576.1 XRE family transcriptional regulator [Apilactobacillus micheneri]TPR47526.1 XRE family transcriptional regulator [Apilactobacillus micheneri]
MSNNDLNSVGKRIKQIRFIKGMTQEKFANEINGYEQQGNISKGTVNNWEHDRNMPNKERLKIISEMGNTSVSYLINGDNELENFYDDLIKNVKNRKRKHKEYSVELSKEEKESIKKHNEIMMKRFNKRQKELNISNKELAKRLNISMSTLYRYKRDSYENASFRLLKEDVCSALNISPRYAIFQSIKDFETMIEYRESESMGTYIKENILNLKYKDIKDVFNYVKERSESINKYLKSKM